MKRKLSAFNLHTMYTWVDASYAVHPDMRSHTGGAISFGVGALNVIIISSGYGVYNYSVDDV